MSAGANYWVNDQWKLRCGIAWDQSPVQDAERTPRLPDADRCGSPPAAVQVDAKQWKFDVGLAYIGANRPS